MVVEIMQRIQDGEPLPFRSFDFGSHDGASTESEQ